MLELASDRIRLAHLKAPDEQVFSNDLSPAKTDLLTEDSDFAYVRETPNYLVYTERWLPVCRAAVKRKYGSSSNATIMAHLTPRFARVGEELGLRMKHHEIVAGKSVVIYAKPLRPIVTADTRRPGRKTAKRSRRPTKAPTSLRGLK